MTKVLIPTSHEDLVTLRDEAPNPSDFVPAETEVLMKSDRHQPELRNIGLPLHMNVRRLFPVTSIEEEPIGTGTKHGWHIANVCSGDTRSKLRRAGCAGARHLVRLMKENDAPQEQFERLGLQA